MPPQKEVAVDDFERGQQQQQQQQELPERKPTVKDTACRMLAAKKKTASRWADCWQYLVRLLSAISKLQRRPSQSMHDWYSGEQPAWPTRIGSSCCQ